MKPTKQWLEELPHPYNELALSVVDENWLGWQENAHTLCGAVAYMCDWEKTAQGEGLWGAVWRWATYPQKYPLPPIPEPIMEGAVEIPFKEQSKDWEAMYWEMVQARTSAVKEVQELKGRIAKFEQGISEMVLMLEKKIKDKENADWGTYNSGAHDTAFDILEAIKEKLKL